MVPLKIVYTSYTLTVTLYVTLLSFFKGWLNAMIEVKLYYDVVFMFCDVLLYQMHVKYQTF